MGIFRHPKSGVWFGDYFDAFQKRHRPSLRTKDKRVAEIKFADIRRAQRTIKETDSINVSWPDFKLKFMAFAQANRAPNTVERFRIAMQQLEDFSKLKVLVQVTPGLLEDFQTFLKIHKTTDKVAGINRTVRAIKTIMRQAENWELIPPQKWNRIHKFKEPQGRVIFYTEEEVKKLLTGCDKISTGKEWKLVILLGARAGLRRGEIAALRWQDVDFKNNQLYIAPNKTEHCRYIPIAEDLLKALKQAKTAEISDFVINVGKQSSRGQFDYLTSYYKEIERLAGLDKGTLHTLRHTFASHLVQNGVDLYTVSKLLGHSSIKMTEIYAHLAPDTLRQAIGKLPKLD